MARTTQNDRITALESAIGAIGEGMAALLAAQNGSGVKVEADAPKVEKVEKVEPKTKGPKDLRGQGRAISGGQLKALRYKLNSADLPYDDTASITVKIGGKVVAKDWDTMADLLASL